LAQGRDLLTIFLILFRLFFNDMAPHSSVALLRCRRGVDLSLLWLSVGAYVYLKQLCLLNFPLKPNGLLFLPTVASERLFIGR
jgi:hypothetical protein